MIARKDLVDIGDVDYHDRQGEYMLCQHCSMSFGGTRGDYWQMAMDAVFHCADCQSDNIALVRDVTTTVRVK